MLGGEKNNNKKQNKNKQTNKKPKKNKPYTRFQSLGQVESLYRRAKFEYNSLNILRGIAN